MRSTTLTTGAAREIGVALRFVRTAQRLSLRDVAAQAGIAPQYVQNIEHGERGNVSLEVYHKIAGVLGIDARTLDSLLLRGRVTSALEQFGADADTRAFVWRGVEQRLGERGLAVRADMATMVAGLLQRSDENEATVRGQRAIGN